MTENEIKISAKGYFGNGWVGSYLSMMARCYVKTNNRYEIYGGRGIEVCPEWHNVENFAKWCEESNYQKGLTLDRINPDRNYEPNNCRWITMREQQNNRRNNRRIEYNGEVHTLAEWARILNLNPGTLQYRLGKLGWSVERAFTEKPFVGKNQSFAH